MGNYLAFDASDVIRPRVNRRYLPESSNSLVNNLLLAHGPAGFCSILFYSRLCPSTAGSSRPSSRVLRLSLSFAVLVHTAPCCPTMSSPQRRFGLPTDLTPFICHSLILIIHLLSFIRAMCLAHFHLAFGSDTKWACRRIRVKSETFTNFLPLALVHRHKNLNTSHTF